MEDASDVQKAFEVTHHVDSALGFAVTIAIFVLNLPVTGTSTSIYATDLGLSIAVSVLCGLFGILRQKWNMKMFAWWSVIFCGTLVLSTFLLQTIHVFKVPTMGEFLTRVISGVSSYLFLKLVVVDAYLRRLRKVSSKSTIQRYEDLLRKYSNQAIFFPLLVFSWASLYHVDNNTVRWPLMIASFLLLFVLAKWYGNRP